MKRSLSGTLIIQSVKDALHRLNTTLDPLVLQALQQAVPQEDSPIAIDILETLVANAEAASTEDKPLCQDTGLVVAFVEVGADVEIREGLLPDLIQQAVRESYQENYFRASVVKDPLFHRDNTQDNTPAIIHARIVPGDRLHIALTAKGGGAENKSSLMMFAPTAEAADIIDFVLATVRNAGGQACPPLIIGMGIGGNFETCALLAKRALLRPLGQHHTDPQWSSLESEILSRVNQTGIGPLGLGGNTTALAVHIETAPCHIASLPVAINIQCHSHRHETLVL